MPIWSSGGNQHTGKLPRPQIALLARPSMLAAGPKLLIINDTLDHGNLWVTLTDPGAVLTGTVIRAFTSIDGAPGREQAGQFRLQTGRMAQVLNERLR